MEKDYIGESIKKQVRDRERERKVHFYNIFNRNKSNHIKDCFQVISFKEVS